VTAALIQRSPCECESLDKEIASNGLCDVCKSFYICAICEGCSFCRKVQKGECLWCTDTTICDFHRRQPLAGRPAPPSLLRVKGTCECENPGTQINLGTACEICKFKVVCSECFGCISCRPVPASTNGSSIKQEAAEPEVPYEIIGSNGSYRVTWFRDNLIIKIDQIKESQLASISGEVRFLKKKEDGHEKLLYVTRIPLLSFRDRHALAKYLEDDLTSVEVDAWTSYYAWEELINRTCTLVLNRHRQGEPLVVLSDYTASSDEIVYHINPIVQVGQPTLLSGEGESGKSLLATYLGLLVTSGHSHPFSVATPKTGRVLYLDYEADQDEVERRLRRLAAGLGIPKPPGFFYRRMAAPLASELEPVQRIVTNENIDFVIVDSAVHAAGVGQSEDIVTSYFQALRSLKVGSLTIGHVTKRAPGGMPFGSVYWYNAPRLVFRVAAVNKGDIIRVSISQEKANNDKRVSPSSKEKIARGGDRREGFFFQVEIGKIGQLHIASCQLGCNSE
jgi:hypothetical protein